MAASNQAFGGVFWCDWRYLPYTPGVKQIVGHTRGHDVRKRADETRCCLDTHLRHYGVLDGYGNLVVKEVYPTKTNGVAETGYPMRDSDW